MPFDGIVTYAVTNELKTTLIGGRINKIYQPTNSEIVITIRNQGKNHHLLASIHPNYARFHVTDDRFQNPKEPPMFCMTLRKHLSGAILEDIQQEKLERVVSFRYRQLNEIGDEEIKNVQLEIMGRHSNVLLLNADKTKIIHCLKTVPPFQNRHRSIVPGADYIAPPVQDKLDIQQTDAADFVHKLDFNKGKLDQQIVQQLGGISKVIGKEMAYQAHLGSHEAFKAQFNQLKQTITEQDFQPAIYRNKKEEFHVIPLEHLSGEKETYPSANEMADAFFSNKATRDRVEQQAKDIRRIVNNELDKNKRKLSIHQQTLKKSRSAEEYQVQGELLTAHMHLVNKGDAEVTVIDYYDPEQKERTIPLQTDKTPSENAQQFFKKYRKLQAAETKAKKELIKTKREIKYLDDIVQQLDTARDQDILDIREELQEEGYLKKQTRKKQKKKRPTPDKYIATDGTAIYVGRNNKQNEYVTQQIAHKNDTWLHTLDIPGSHVVIKHDNPSETTLYEAAMIAAHFSKARGSSSVPVDYTLIKNVKKPSGGKPGFVTYTQQKTLYVTPDETKIRSLQDTTAHHQKS
ncbi:MAG TPA: NFACT RNA binding domain-containing protein [Pseudogracilibacillus sp.]|nr:NFACT RNA binding domain-containing protein [Pseudogracilibacillus sp.]